VFVAVKDLHHVGAASRAALGFISRATFLYGELTARENLKFVGRLYGLPELEKKVDARRRSGACCSRSGICFVHLCSGHESALGTTRLGIWWTWDARLTSTFVLWLLFIAYLMLRCYVFNPGRAAVLGAVVGILGFVGVPIVYMSIRWWRTQHPQPVIAGGEGSGIDPQMKFALLVRWGAYLCLFSYLVRVRLGLANARREATLLRREFAPGLAKE
jgi:ABC-type transport system involved in cytochrome c biogenesis permease subunit